jgi:hypothetical protein
MRPYLTLLGVLASLGGCAGLEDPYQRAGTWAPTGINAENLRLMVVNPVDLQQGTGAKDTLGVEASVPVARLRNDNVKILPDSTLSQVGGSAGSGGQGGGGGAGGAPQ